MKHGRFPLVIWGKQWAQGITSRRGTWSPHWNCQWNMCDSRRMKCLDHQPSTWLWILSLTVLELHRCHVLEVHRWHLPFCWFQCPSPPCWQLHHAACLACWCNCKVFSVSIGCLSCECRCTLLSVPCSYLWWQCVCWFLIGTVNIVWNTVIKNVLTEMEDQVGLDNAIPHSFGSWSNTSHLTHKPLYGTMWFPDLSFRDGGLLLLLVPLEERWNNEYPILDVFHILQPLQSSPTVFQLLWLLVVRGEDLSESGGVECEQLH